MLLPSYFNVLYILSWFINTQLVIYKESKDVHKILLPSYFNVLYMDYLGL